VTNSGWLFTKIIAFYNLFVVSKKRKVSTRLFTCGLVKAEFAPTFVTFCRVVSQVDYPSLVDLRSLLLDLVAQLLGALSRIRYASYILDFCE
jgi:hypothetical protein